MYHSEEISIFILLKDVNEMASPLHDFGRIAQRLSRNPLGIVALFIVLVYGIAGLVLGASSSNLEHSERLPLVWFLVVFTFKFPEHELFGKDLSLPDR